MAKKKNIAAFDFDGTLYDGDSFIDFALFAVGRKKLLVSILANLHWLTGWKMGFVQNERAKQKLFYSLFSGMSYESFLKKCDSFSKIIELKIKDHTLSLLKQHKEKGHLIYVISASPAEWISPWAEKIEVDGVIGTGLKIEEGAVTGEFSTLNCYGGEKVRRLVELEPDRSQYELWAYGDSRGDKELLAFSDHPVKIV